MEIWLDQNGKIIKTNSDSWADKSPTAVYETYYCESNLKVALRARNARKKELKRLGFTDITCEPYIDDVDFSPPKTIGYIVDAFKP